MKHYSTINNTKDNYLIESQHPDFQEYWVTHYTNVKKRHCDNLPEEKSERVTIEGSMTVGSKDFLEVEVRNPDDPNPNITKNAHNPMPQDLTDKLHELPLRTKNVLMQAGIIKT